MKKPINLLLAVQTLLLISIAAVMFSSCIIVHPNEEEEIFIEKREKESKSSKSSTSSSSKTTTKKYSITCRNQTNMTVTDWCVAKENIVTYADSSFNRMIGPYKEDKIQNLSEGYYKVYFSFEDDGFLCPTSYLSSDSIQLNQDVIYTLFTRSSGYAVDCRNQKSAAPAVLCLQGSDGSNIELIKE